MRRRGMAVVGTAGVVALAPIAVAAACAGPEPASRADVGTVAPPARDHTAARAPRDDADRTAAPVPAPTEPVPVATAELATVDAVLEEYGRLLGELSADPAGRPAPGSEALRRWDAVVLPGSDLSTAMLDRLHTRATLERTVVQPNAQGVSFRHRATTVTGASEAAIAFEWCGWSPGIGRSLDTGEVVDNLVGHATGSGRVVRRAGGWQLAELDQSELELLAPGSGDPCSTSTSGTDR